MICAVIGFGVFFIDFANWTPFIPENTGVWGEFGWSGILRASGVIFFAYIGFDAVSTAAQEAKKPSFDLPFGLLMGLFICTVLYILMSATLTGMVSYTQLNDAAPVAVALREHAALQWLIPFVVFGALAGLTSVVLVLIMAQARILLARRAMVCCHLHLQKYILNIARRVSQPGDRHRGFADGWFVSIGILAELVSIGTLVAFIMVCASVLVLRYTRPEMPRPFRTPYPWFVCLAGVFFCGLMALSLPLDTWLRLIIWMLVGICVYYFYGRHHSVARKEAGV